MDIWIDVCAFLTRDFLEKSQLVNRKWHKIIENYQNILPIRSLKMWIRKDQKTYDIFKIDLEWNDFRNTLTFNEFNEQKEGLLRASIISQMSFDYPILLNLENFKNAFFEFKKLSKPLYIHETLLNFTAPERDEEFFNFWPEYFNGQIISTSVLRLNGYITDLNYYLANFSMFNIMKKGTRIYLNCWSYHTHNLDKELLFKKENELLMVEPYILNGIFSLDLFEFIIESFLSKKNPSLLFKQYEIWKRHNWLEFLSERFPNLNVIVTEQEQKKQCVLERPDCGKRLIIEEKAVDLILKITQ